MNPEVGPLRPPAAPPVPAGVIVGSEVIGIGIDVVAIERVRLALARTHSFESRVFSRAEIQHCRSRPDPATSFAARFAAKEAVLKVLGLGIFDARLSDIEVTGGGGEPPGLLVPLPQARTAGVDRWLVSLSHDAGVAAAVAVALGGDAPSGAAERHDRSG